MTIKEIKPEGKYVIEGYNGYWVAVKVDLKNGLVLCERRNFTNPTHFSGKFGNRNKPVEKIFKIEQFKSTYNISTETI